MSDILHEESNTVDAVDGSATVATELTDGRRGSDGTMGVVAGTGLGAISGAVIGSASGPIGTVVGAIAGGMLGSAAGEAAHHIGVDHNTDKTAPPPTTYDDSALGRGIGDDLPSVREDDIERPF